MADARSLVIESAEGCWLTTTDGQRLFDGVSSMWCNIHGHQHPRLDAAIREQLDRVAHVTSLGMSCETTDRFAQALVAICPEDLNHVFLSSDGASAVEAAIKMALQYWRQCEQPCPDKTNYLALDRAYHGDTIGGASLGGIEHFHRIFSPLLFQPLRGPLPCSYRLPPGVTAANAAAHYVGEIECILKEHHRSLAAVVVEPLIQGAAGMITHPAGFLARVRDLCTRYNVLLICDEVATGFGRTGAMFACEHESVTPDILCLGKGITGGYLPLAATVATTRVFEAFLGRSEERRQFFHGHTYGGNPLAAAVALASLELFEEQQLVDIARRHGERMRNRLDSILDHPRVGNIRGRGMMIGIELVQDRESRQPLHFESKLIENVCTLALQRGLWIRPLGDVLVLMPPLAATREDLDWMVDVVVESINVSSATST
jgi:adenosylmethionine-8-amino-7-oxononanoate transaminase